MRYTLGYSRGSPKLPNRIKEMVASTGFMDTEEELHSKAQRTKIIKHNYRSLFYRYRSSVVWTLFEG